MYSIIAGTFDEKMVHRFNIFSTHKNVIKAITKTMFK